MLRQVKVCCWKGLLKRSRVFLVRDFEAELLEGGEPESKPDDDPNDPIKKEKNSLTIPVEGYSKVKDTES